MYFTPSKIKTLILIFCLLIAAFPGAVSSAEPPGPPPARVVTAPLVTRQVSPTISLTGKPKSALLTPRAGMAAKEALKASVESRIRPIFMSSLTSILGMLPLVLFPGAGSELYRGLGSVVLGGLALSTVFTIFMVPALLAFFIKD